MPSNWHCVDQCKTSWSKKFAILFPFSDIVHRFAFDKWRNDDGDSNRSCLLSVVFLCRVHVPRNAARLAHKRIRNTSVHVECINVAHCVCWMCIDLRCGFCHGADERGDRAFHLPLTNNNNRSTRASVVRSLNAGIFFNFFLHNNSMVAGTSFWRHARNSAFNATLERRYGSITMSQRLQKTSSISKVP